mmetsp:Transcript_15757/g.38752  ORF Transcript_15757/g.38752 Transcript_15757/m.38752 type:complete len:488 (+) Transcript_15757:154-1617(+)
MMCEERRSVASRTRGACCLALACAHQAGARPASAHHTAENLKGVSLVTDRSNFPARSGAYNVGMMTYDSPNSAVSGRSKRTSFMGKYGVSCRIALRSGMILPSALHGKTQKPIILSRLLPRFHCPPSTERVTVNTPGSDTMMRNLGLDDHVTCRLHPPPSLDHCPWSTAACTSGNSSILTWCAECTVIEYGPVTAPGATAEGMSTCECSGVRVQKKIPSLVSAKSPSPTTSFASPTARHRCGATLPSMTPVRTLATAAAPPASRSIVTPSSEPDPDPASAAASAAPLPSLSRLTRITAAVFLSVEIMYCGLEPKEPWVLFPPAVCGAHCPRHTSWKGCMSRSTSTGADENERSTKGASSPHCPVNGTMRYECPASSFKDTVVSRALDSADMPTSSLGSSLHLRLRCSRPHSITAIPTCAFDPSISWPFSSPCATRPSRCSRLSSTSQSRCAVMRYCGLLPHEPLARPPGSVGGPPAAAPTQAPFSTS